MYKLIKEYEDIPLSNFDILKILDNNVSIILYPDLHKYKHIDEILGKYNACILLFESKPKYGHWCAIIKNKNDIEFFNPYGGYPDDSLKKIPLKFALQSNQENPYLSLLLYNSEYNLFYNEFKFQQTSNDIKTCGRHCCVRVKNKHLDIYGYKKYLDELSRNLNVDYDGVVTYLTV